MKAKPHSAMGRISSETSSATVHSKTRPPWRPFSGHAALSQPTPVQNTTNRRFEDTTGKEEELLCGFTELPTVYQDRCLPNSLTFLREWLTEDVPSNWPICYEPQHSFVFVPGVQSEDCAVLPTVPPIQQPEDLLLYNAVPQVKKYKPPKPRFRTFFEDDDLVGKHSGRTNVNSKASLATSCGNTPLHDIYEGKRTTDIVRQEIEDLERLLQGIGNPTGSSVVVRYQSDINNLKDMIKSTLEGYQIYESEDVPRCLTPLAASFQEDLVRYPEQHKTIFQNIKQRRDQCVRELADIERDIMNKVT